MRWLIKSPSIICSGKLKIFTPYNLVRGNPYNQSRDCQATKMSVANFVSRKFTCSSIFPGAWKLTLATNISFPKALLKEIFLSPRWVSKVPTPPRRRCDTRSRRYNTSPVWNDDFLCETFVKRVCVDHACWMISSSVHHHMFVWRCNLITVYWITPRNLPYLI